MLLFSRKPRSRWFWPRSVRITNHLIINEIVSIHGHSETNMELNAFHRVRITSRLTRRLFCGSCTSIALFNGDRIHLIFTCCSCDWVRSPPNFAAHLKIQREISHCIYEENSTSQPSLWFESKGVMLIQSVQKIWSRSFKYNISFNISNISTKEWNWEEGISKIKKQFVGLGVSVYVRLRLHISRFRLTKFGTISGQKRRVMLINWESSGLACSNLGSGIVVPPRRYMANSQANRTYSDNAKYYKSIDLTTTTRLCHQHRHSASQSYSSIEVHNQTEIKVSTTSRPWEYHAIWKNVIYETDRPALGEWSRWRRQGSERLRHQEAR